MAASHPKQTLASELNSQNRRGQIEASLCALAERVGFMMVGVNPRRFFQDRCLKPLVPTSPPRLEVRYS